MDDSKGSIALTADLLHALKGHVELFDKSRWLILCPFDGEQEVEEQCTHEIASFGHLLKVWRRGSGIEVKHPRIAAKHSRLFAQKYGQVSLCKSPGKAHKQLASYRARIKKVCDGVHRETDLRRLMLSQQPWPKIILQCLANKSQNVAGYAQTTYTYDDSTLLQKLNQYPSEKFAPQLRNTLERNSKSEKVRLSLSKTPTLSK